MRTIRKSWRASTFGINPAAVEKVEKLLNADGLEIDKIFDTAKAKQGGRARASLRAAGTGRDRASQ